MKVKKVKYHLIAIMLLIESGSKILEESVREKLLNSESGEKFIILLSDFDGVQFKFSTQFETKKYFVLSMRLYCWKDLLDYGAANVLAREYGAWFDPSKVESGYDISLYIDLDTLSADDKEPAVKQLALFKRHAMAAPFETAFEIQIRKEESALMAIHYRLNEAIYIKALPDRVTVIFSTEFKEETDQVYGRVFLQEFVDARRQPAIQNAPQVLYTNREPPMELRGVSGLKDSDNIGYVTFVLFPRHFLGPLGPGAISKIQVFRDYFHYHIKASKSYLHSRMRARVDSLLKVLNRAKPELPSEQKTASGKTFKRS